MLKMPAIFAIMHHNNVTHAPLGHDPEDPARMRVA